MDGGGGRRRRARRHTIGNRAVVWRVLCALLAGPLAVVWLIGVAQADTYAIDRNHTLVAFTWERIGLSRQQGRFTDVSGSVAFDPAAPEAAQLDISIRASSLQTGVDALDRHLRSVDFFDVATHPVITFRSTAVVKTGEKTGDVTGDLTLLGVTAPVTLQVTWRFSGPHPLGAINPSLAGRTVAVFAARGTLKRSAFGMTRAIPLVSDDIEIVIETETLKK